MSFEKLLRFLIYFSILFSQPFLEKKNWIVKMKLIQPWIFFIFFLVVSLMVTNAVIEYYSNQKDLQRIWTLCLLTTQVLTQIGSECLLCNDKSHQRSSSQNQIRISCFKIAVQTGFCRHPVFCKNARLTYQRWNLYTAIGYWQLNQEIPVFIWAGMIKTEKELPQEWEPIIWWNSDSKNSVGFSRTIPTLTLKKFCNAMVQDSSQILISTNGFPKHF